jgi:uncharacterized membrane protein YfcA
MDRQTGSTTGRLAMLRRGSPTRNFLRHYGEMLIAMFLGMFVLGGAGALLLGIVGVQVSDWDSEAPELLLLGMAFTMTVPMVGWMRHRGHDWRLAWEMAAAMFAPSVVAIVLFWSGLVEDTDTLLGIQHVAMLAAMLAAMLLRREEYTRHFGPGRGRAV